MIVTVLRELFHLSGCFGAGVAGYNDLKNGIDGIEPKKFPHPIFDNCIPTSIPLDNGYTKEEMKMIEETKKILKMIALRSPTTVRFRYIMTQ